jgi:1-acyl-sn-glycerol-3-phosphate acyltransferase
VLGLCWWALDFPFMKRYSPAQIKRNPALAGKDLETTRKACEKFKYTPVSVFNFIEGTRFTDDKHRQQESPFRHLLKPKAGGAAFVLGSMGQQMHTMLDISIVYTGDRPGIWHLLSGKIRRVLIDVRRIEIPAQFLGRDYATDREFKRQYQQWLTQVWQDKDSRIEEMKQRAARIQ